MLTPTQEQLHSEMLSLARRHRELEHQIIEALCRVDREKLFRALGFPSLFVYCVRALGFTESVSYAFIAVMRKSVEVPELATALRAGNLTVSKASRLTAALTNENAAELVEFAQSHSVREVEAKIARESGSKRGRRKIETSIETLELLRRTQDVMKEKDADQALARALSEWLTRHDPLEKAKRAEARKSERDSARNSERDPEHNSERNSARDSERNSARNSARNSERTRFPPTDAKTAPGENAAAPGSARTPDDLQQSEVNRPSGGRSRIPAWVVHAVLLRDQAQCTFVDATGRRCENRRYLELHHIRPVALGGTDDESNLICLCSDHHSLVHQLSFGIEGQLNWVRAPSRAYN